jgi:thiol:disulfide interchange protein DsbC
MQLKSVILAALAATFAGGALADAASDAKVKAAIKSLSPEAVIDSVTPSPIAGFSEVTVQGAVLYVSNDGKYLMQGMLFDVNAKKDLTEARKQGLRIGAMATQPRANRIVFSPPKGTATKHTVSVFTDIDCGFCQRLQSQMADYNKLGIEIQYLGFPRAGIGSESYRKFVAAWCSADKGKALAEAKGGKDPGKASCPNPIEAQYNLGVKVGVAGTPTIVLNDGTLIPGFVPPEELLKRLDGAKTVATK